jgi:hypothetical protein
MAMRMPLHTLQLIKNCDLLHALIKLQCKVYKTPTLHIIYFGKNYKLINDFQKFQHNSLAVANISYF